MKARNHLKTLKLFPYLPDEATVHPAVAAMVIGGCEDTARSHPKLKKVHISGRITNIQVGSIRRLLAEGSAAISPRTNRRRSPTLRP